MTFGLKFGENTQIDSTGGNERFPMSGKVKMHDLVVTFCREIG